MRGSSRAITSFWVLVDLDYVEIVFDFTLHWDLVSDSKEKVLTSVGVGLSDVWVVLVLYTTRFLRPNIKSSNRKKIADSCNASDKGNRRRGLKKKKQTSTYIRNRKMVSSKQSDTDFNGKTERT